jgi:uncharacterized protein YigA (DUF484 family)
MNSRSHDAGSSAGVASTDNQHHQPAATHTDSEADRVAAYLRRHPTFLEDYPELLEILMPPKRRQYGDAVVDLQTAMIERMRNENRRIGEQQADLLATSRANMTTQSRIHAGVLALLEATTFENLIQAITTDLAMLLDVDVVALCVEAPDTNPRRDVAGVHMLVPGEVDDILGPNRDIVLVPITHMPSPLYGGGAGLVRSEALLRLRPSARAPMGLLALGSRVEGRFDPSQGTELLGFLARILELCIRTWLELPHE